METQMEDREPQTDAVKLPAPTAWPMVLALGLSLVIAGMVTTVAISLLGLVLAVIGQRRLVPASVADGAARIRRRATSCRYPPSARVLLSRGCRSARCTARCCRWKPIKSRRGSKAGSRAGVAMSVPAMLFGLIKYHSIWYAINLLAAGGFVSWAGRKQRVSGAVSLRRDFWRRLRFTALRRCWSGSCMARCFRCFPNTPILTCGFIAPFLWTGLVYSILGIVSPILDQRIDWLWFTISQCAFGLVAGFVVNLDVKVRTPQFQCAAVCRARGLAYRSWPAAREERQSRMSVATSLTMGFCRLCAWCVWAVRMRPGIPRLGLKFHVRTRCWRLLLSINRTARPATVQNGKNGAAMSLGESGLSGSCRRSHLAQSCGGRCERQTDAGVRQIRGRHAYRSADRQPGSRHGPDVEPPGCSWRLARAALCGECEERSNARAESLCGVLCALPRCGRQGQPQEASWIDCRSFVSGAGQRSKFAEHDHCRPA